MPLTIPDEVLKDLKMDEREARIEIACRLYDAQKLQLFTASRLAGLDRTQMEAALIERKLPVYRYTEEHFKQDMTANEAWRKENVDRSQRHFTGSSACESGAATPARRVV